MRINECSLDGRAKPLEYEIDSEGCWIVTSHKPYSTGYVMVIRDGRRIAAHKYVKELVGQKIPDELHGLHSCDVRPCINPDHVFAGTNLENIQDKMDKGRHRVARGEDCGASRLEEEDVHEIRYLHSIGYSQKFLADGYGLKHPTVSNIISRKRWRHI